MFILNIWTFLVIGIFKNLLLLRIIHQPSTSYFMENEQKYSAYILFIRYYVKYFG